MPGITQVFIQVSKEVSPCHQIFSDIFALLMHCIEILTGLITKLLRPYFDVASNTIKAHGQINGNSKLDDYINWNILAWNEGRKDGGL